MGDLTLEGYDQPLLFPCEHGTQIEFCAQCEAIRLRRGWTPEGYELSEFI